MRLSIFLVERESSHDWMGWVEEGSWVQVSANGCGHRSTIDISKQ